MLYFSLSFLHYTISLLLACYSLTGAQIHSIKSASIKARVFNNKCVVTDMNLQHSQLENEVKQIFESSILPQLNDLYGPDTFLQPHVQPFIKASHLATTGWVYSQWTSAGLLLFEWELLLWWKWWKVDAYCLPQDVWSKCTMPRGPVTNSHMLKAIRYTHQLSQLYHLWNSLI